MTKIIQKVDELSELRELQFINHGVTETLNDDLVEVKLNIYEGKKFTIERINISGNFELVIQWLEISFSLGRKIQNNKVTDAAGNLLLKLFIKRHNYTKRCRKKNSRIVKKEKN